jgi:hypothetical protein
MKKAELLQKLNQQGAVFVRHGVKHGSAGVTVTEFA